MENKLLDSRYKIIKSLGKGGFGKTYLAEDTKRPHNPHCVVKQLHPGVDEPNFLELARRLFAKEAETLEKLGTYDQIPRLLANFEQDNEFYLVQEYIQGQTLSQELVLGEPWSEEKVIAFLADCLTIIDFIHSNGVIHRDIKPDNLIRRLQDHKLVLVDFGTVKEVVMSQTQAIASTVAVGTRGYMPTEQARGKPRFTSDIYALGIIAVQALTGVHPIQLQEDPNGEIIWQAQCSSRLREIISTMVRYHFRDRYQSAKDVLDSLAIFNQNISGIPATQAVQYTPTVQVEPAPNSNDLTSAKNTSDGLSSTSAEPAKQQESSHSVPESNVPDTDLSNLPQSKTKLSSEPVVPTPVSTTSSTKPEFLVKLADFMKSPTAITIGVALLIGAIATGGMYFLSSNSDKKRESTVSTTLEEIAGYYNAKNYDQCSAKAQDKASKEMGISQKDINTWIGKCELGKAQNAADVEEYENAIGIAIKISEDEFPNYKETRKKIDIWSQEVLRQAKKTYEQGGDIKEAKKMIVNVIPESSAIKMEALDLKAQWEQEYQTNQPILEAAQKALRENRWEKAKIEIAKIADNSSEYWQVAVQDVLEEANKELESRNKSSGTNLSSPGQSSGTTNISPSRSGSGTNLSSPGQSSGTTNISPPRRDPKYKENSKPPAVIDVCRDAPELC